MTEATYYFIGIKGSLLHLLFCLWKMQFQTILLVKRQQSIPHNITRQ